MTVSRAARVVIVGGGVTGLSTAWWLAQRGVDVVVLEKGIVGWEASGRNGGGCTHVGSPLFGEEQRLWPQLDDMLGYPTEFTPNRIWIALNERQHAETLDVARAGEREGKQTVMLDRKELRDLVPFAGDEVFSAALFKFGGHANPQRTVQGYAWALQDLGGRVIQHAEVTDFGRTGGRVTSVITTKGQFGCDGLVIAAGPGSGRLAARLGVHLPLAPARAEMIVTAPVPLMSITGTDGNNIYGRQTLRGNLVYGGGPHEWLRLDPDLRTTLPSTHMLQYIGKRLVELFPRLAHVRMIRSWAGIVENTPDGRPVLDRLEDPGNVVVATMSSVGFGLSPASGRAVSELILDGKCSFADLSSCKLSRFLDLPDDWRERRGWVPPAEAA